ncbi:MAG: hypothetical protein QM759_06725 [Terricaulis sp.]
MRLLLLLLLIAAAAYYTNPPRAKFETEARVELQAQQEIARNDPAAAQQRGFSLDQIVGYVRGMMAGQGQYENYYVAGKYTIDMPGADYLECYGAFAMVKCQTKSE